MLKTFRRQFFDDDALVLCYHAVSESWPVDQAVAPAALREQVELLLTAGYRPMTLADSLASGEGRALAVTFDDAYRSVLDVALPVLQELGVVATVFVVTDFADSGRPLVWEGIDRWAGGPHAAELEGLTWSDLDVVRRAGWEVGSHTRTHLRLTSLGDQALADELRASKRSCEEALGAPCVSLAYPYGDVNRHVVQAVGDAGYRYAVTLPGYPHRAEPLSWPRVGVYRMDSLRRFRTKVSPGVRAVRRRIRR